MLGTDPEVSWWWDEQARKALFQFSDWCAQRSVSFQQGASLLETTFRNSEWGLEICILTPRLGDSDPGGLERTVLSAACP